MAELTNTAPEDLQPATPPEPVAPTASGAQTPAGKQLEPILNGLLDHLGEQVQGHPVEAMVFDFAKKALSGPAADQVAALLGGGTVTLRSVVDKSFQYLEGLVPGRPIVLYALKGTNVLIDNVGLPALQLYLLSKGITLPVA